MKKGFKLGWIFPLFFLSGLTGLVYQIIWTRHLILIFGSTVLGISTVVSIFLGGLALGSYLFGIRADRSAKPLQFYGLLEIAIGIYAIFIPWLFQITTPIYQWIWSWSAGHYELLNLFRFAIAACLLLFPTILMGGTLPLLVSQITRQKISLGVSVGKLYGINTLGAVIGVTLSGFVLLPWLGLQTTNWACALANIAIGALAILYDRKRHVLEMPSTKIQITEVHLQQKWIFLAAFVSGFAALNLEICWSRLFGLIYGSSLHGFCITLAAFLIGIGFGSLFQAGRAMKSQATVISYAAVLLSTALGIVLSFFLIHELIFLNFVVLPAYFDNPQAWALVRACMIGGILLLPTFCMGIAFPLAASLLKEVEHAAALTGKLYAWITLGNILGAFCTGFFLLPWLGLEGSMLTALGIFVLLGIAILFVKPQLFFVNKQPVTIYAFLLLPLSAILFLQRPVWDPAYLSMGGVYFRDRDTYANLGNDLLEKRDNFFARAAAALAARELLYYRDGRNASVGVYQAKESATIYLRVNGKVDASTGLLDMSTQILSAVFPMLTQSDPQNALVIGMGSGTTVGTLTLFPQLQEIKVVELEKAVMQASDYFRPHNFNPLQDSRVQRIENDGRNALLLEAKIYDLIVSEPSNPWMSGAANLFTKEFFRLVKQRLNPQGIFCQWLQLYSISPENFAVLLRTFLQEFPQVVVLQTNAGDILLLASQSGKLLFDLEKIQNCFQAPRLQQALASISITRMHQLLQRFLLSTQAAQELAGLGAINTDDNLYIESATPYNLFQDTLEANQEVLSRAALRLTSHIKFPASKDEAAQWALQLAQDFQQEQQNNFARHFFAAYQEFVHDGARALPGAQSLAQELGIIR